MRGRYKYLMNQLNQEYKMHSPDSSLDVVGFNHGRYLALAAMYIHRG
jgi:hypothetical protein